MAIPSSFYSQTLADNTVNDKGKPELTTWSFPTATLTPLNVAAQETLAGNLIAAVAAVILGNPVQAVVTYSRADGPKVPSDNILAQRENKWLFSYHDAVTNENFTRSVGTADLSKLVPHKEYIDLTTGDGAAIKTAWEAVVVSNTDQSHATVLDSITFVGRNT